MEDRGYSPRKVDWKRWRENTEAEETELEEPKRGGDEGGRKDDFRKNQRKVAEPIYTEQE